MVVPKGEGKTILGGGQEGKERYIPSSQVASGQPYFLLLERGREDTGGKDIYVMNEKNCEKRNDKQIERECEKKRYINLRRGCSLYVVTGLLSSTKQLFKMQVFLFIS